MKYILLAFTLIITQTFSDISMVPSMPMGITLPEPIQPIVRPPTRPEKPPVRPEKPLRPKERYLPKRQYNYYNTNIIENCDQYIKIIEENNREIDALKQEIDRLRSVAQAQLQKKLSEEHAKELKKFDERKSGIKTQNSMSISTEPVQ